MDSQLKRGILNICILQILCEEDMYGYDVIKCVQKYFSDTEDSTVYAILRRLNKDGLLSMYHGGMSAGPPRKYYKITEKGRKALEEYINSVKEINSILFEMGILTK